MGILLTYIIKSGVCLALFYLFYRVLLSRETFHRFNRFALLGVLGLAVGLPFIRYTQTETVLQADSVLPIEATTIRSGAYLFPTELPALTKDMPEQPATSITPFVISLLLTIYIAGVLFFFLRTAWSFFQFFRLMHRGTPPILENNIRIYIVAQEIAPFSWMNRVVVSQQDWEENRQEILAHETGHIRYRHSWDLLFIQLCTILHWFNPAVWLLKQELQNIHEFEADTYVLDKGIEAKQYQLLLIKKAVGSQRFTSMANSFNHSKLKKRIAMMLKSKSSPWARMKYLYILPLSILITTAFARPEIAEPLQKISDVKITEIFPEKKTPQEKTDLLVQISDSVKNFSMIEELIDSFEQMVEETEALADNEQAIAEIALMRQELAKQSFEQNFVVQKEEEKTVHIIDGKEVSQEAFDKLNPADIYSFTILTEKEINEKYPTKTGNKLIEVITKQAVHILAPTIHLINIYGEDRQKIYHIIFLKEEGGIQENFDLDEHVTLTINTKKAAIEDLIALQPGEITLSGVQIKSTKVKEEPFMKREINIFTTDINK